MFFKTYKCQGNFNDLPTQIYLVTAMLQIIVGFLFFVSEFFSEAASEQRGHRSVRLVNATGGDAGRQGDHDASKRCQVDSQPQCLCDPAG